MLKKVMFAAALAVLPAGAAPAQSLFDVFSPPENGQMLPMEDILARAREAADGAITEIELERKKGRWVYEVDVVERDGRKYELLFDPWTGSLLSRKRERD